MEGDKYPLPYFKDSMTQKQVVSYPTPLYSNPPIEPQFYQPSQFFISALVIGVRTLVTTTEDNNYQVGQLVRFIIAKENGTIQLNGQSGYVVEIPNPNQILVDIDSSSYDTFKSFNQVTLSQVNVGPSGTSPWSFNLFNLLGLPIFPIVPGSVKLVLPGVYIFIDQGNGILLGMSFPLLNFGTINYATGDVSITFVSPPVGNVLVNVTYNTTQLTKSQILAIGDINSGNLNASGNVNTGTFIPGSFINISPL